MAFRNDRLRDILRVKGLEPADVHRLTGISYPQLQRYQGKGRPDVDTLAIIVSKLDVDADYLLGTDQRYENMKPVRAVTIMALDLYVNALAVAGHPIEPDREELLRLVAEQHSAPPLWVADWAKEHESISLRTAKKVESAAAAAPRPHRTRRSLRP
jgi:hypothetical protein